MHLHAFFASMTSNSSENVICTCTCITMCHRNLEWCGRQKTLYMYVHCTCLSTHACTHAHTHTHLPHAGCESIRLMFLCDCSCSWSWKKLREAQYSRLPSSAVRMKVMKEGGVGEVESSQPRGWQNCRRERVNTELSKDKYNLASSSGLSAFSAAMLPSFSFSRRKIWKAWEWG